MRPGSPPLVPFVLTLGGLYLGGIVLLIVTRTPLGSPLFFAVAAAGGAACLALLARTHQESEARSPWLLAMALAVAFRIPLAVAPVGADSDMVRYLWDGRVQQLGYNPYDVVPADPALARTHRGDSARMPSRGARTPYPPAAQLFFRLIVSVHDSRLAMKLALVGCDLLTMVVLWRWLLLLGQREWLVVAYAWNPLVVLEIAHSGHIDALAALWTVTSAYWLTRRRTSLAVVAFVLAVTTKLLPVVLAPLFVGRIRARDAALGAALFAGLYLHFRSAGTVPVGAVPNVIAYIRFNGPVFAAVSALTSPPVAAATAVGLGLAAASVARWTRPISDPAAWAWPMAVALACAPVIYPWYLLCLTPFLLSKATWPLTAWTFSALSAYVVWHLSRHGGRWTVPPAVQLFEYGVPVIVLMLLAILRVRAWPPEPHPARARPDSPL
jgi:hypothetical protein